MLRALQKTPQNVSRIALLGQVHLPEKNPSCDLGDSISDIEILKDVITLLNNGEIY